MFLDLANILAFPKYNMSGIFYMQGPIRTSPKNLNQRTINHNSDASLPSSRLFPWVTILQQQGVGDKINLKMDDSGESNFLPGTHNTL